MLMLGSKSVDGPLSVKQGGKEDNCRSSADAIAHWVRVFLGRYGREAISPPFYRSGSIKLEGSNAFEKTQDIRRKLPKLIRQYRPTFAAMEAPLTFIPSFKKKTRTLIGVEEETTSTPTRLCR